MLCTKSRETYAPHGFADEIETTGMLSEGEWRQEAHDLFPLQAKSTSNKSSKCAGAIRQSFTDYFVGPGHVDWQWKTLL